LGGDFLRGPLDAVGKRLVGRWEVNSLGFPAFKLRMIFAAFNCAGCKTKAQDSVFISTLILPVPVLVVKKTMFFRYCVTVTLGVD
jgi:hypothetical protein